MAEPLRNDNLVLIGGDSGSGKSASLMNLKDPEKVMYLNCEAGKKLPFRSKFKTATVLEPYQVYKSFDFAKANPDKFHTIVIDTSTFLMDMFISTKIIGAKDTMQGWLMYAEYFKNLMQQYVASSPQNVIILAHLDSVYNESAMIVEKKVPVKGSLAKNGIEAFFSTVITAKKVLLPALEKFPNELLNVTAKDKVRGYKHVFQTEITADTINERMRGPIGLWSDQETFIDNDAQLVLDRLNQFYA